MEIRSRYDIIGESKGIEFKEPSMTQQHFKDECDINTILSHYAVTGVIDHINEREPIFADVSNMVDFQQAQNMILQANEDFMQLPSAVRKRFDNNPAALIDFLQDENNREEAIKLGIINDTTTRNDISINSTAPSMDLDNPVSLKENNKNN